MLRVWGDKSHLFTNQQLKHAWKWVITINSRILHALACLVLSHPTIFVSWTIFSAESFWKSCFARTVCLPGAIPEFTSGSLGNFTSSQLFQCCIPCLQQLPITTSYQVQLDVNSLPFTDRSVWFSPAQHPAHASRAYLVPVWKHLCITGTEVLQQQFSIRSLFLFFFVLKPLLNLYESAIVMRIGNFLCSIRSWQVKESLHL